LTTKNKSLCLKFEKQFTVYDKGKIMKKYIPMLLPILIFAGFTADLNAKDRSVVKIGGSVNIEKDMRVDDAVAIGGSVYVDGIVDGNAVAVGGTVYLSEEAVIHGDAVTIGGSIDKSEGAMIYGSTVDATNLNFEKYFDGDHFFEGHRKISRIFKIISFIGLIALVLLFVLLFAVLIPNELKSIANYIIDEPLKVFLYGLLGAILIIPFIVLLAISIIGIVLIPVVIIAVLLAFMIGYIAVAIIIGKKLLRALNNESPALIFCAILGVLVLWLVGLIPFFGTLVKCIAAIFGFGAVILAVAMRQRNKRESVVVAEPTEVITEKEA